MAEVRVKDLAANSTATPLGAPAARQMQEAGYAPKPARSRVSATEEKQEAAGIFLKNAMVVISAPSEPGQRSRSAARTVST